MLTVSLALYNLASGLPYLNRDHLHGKRPAHSYAHIVHSAAALWDPGRGHSGPESESRSSSLGGNELNQEQRRELGKDHSLLKSPEDTYIIWNKKNREQ